MSEFQIKNIQDLINPILTANRRYVESKISKLTAAGDNYGSLMLGVLITLEDDQGNRENVNLVAKLLPQNEIVQQLFNCQYTYRNEVCFYKTVAPTLQKFQKEQGLNEVFNSFPVYINSRFSLDPAKTEIDGDACLLIKNIKDEGYINVDRKVGFNLEQTHLILEKMAELHGTVIALKLLKPQIFDEKLQPFFQEYVIFDIGVERRDQMINHLTEMLKDDEFCSRHMDRIEYILYNNHTGNKRNNKEEQESVFSSFVHSDMWSNNIMIKVVQDKIIHVKFIDFQIYEYSSLTKDVIFFLYTSVQLSVIQQHCDMLLKFYYDCLISCLKKLKCDTSPFSFDGFISEIKISVQKSEFFHILLMLAPIYASTEDTKEIEELDEDKMIDQRQKVSDICKEKGYFIVQEFLRRNWI